MATVAWFKELHKSDTGIAGGKGANLGELENAGFPVPPGFVITAEAYLAAMDAAGIRGSLVEMIESVDIDDQTEVATTCKKLQELVGSAPVPPSLEAEVLDAYHQLGPDTLVAVRSSATTEDLAGASFAGMNQTFTNVRGDEQLISKLRDCWSSIFGDRVITYRGAQGVVAEPAIAVIVQEMLRPDSSGVMFTADPSSGDLSRIVIEAAFGQGEVVVGGQVQPDTYVLSKVGPSVLEIHVGQKTHKIVRGPSGDERIDLGPKEGGARVLSDEQLIALAQLAQRVEEHYGEP
ncbi:MAG: PEP/pyruvate-binding domain-containing protein, partial [Acidimicrobiales bacterium]